MGKKSVEMLVGIFVLLVARALSRASASAASVSPSQARTAA